MSQLRSMSVNVGKTVGRVVSFVQRRETLCLVGLLLLFPFVTADWSLATFILIYGLFAMAYNICLGEAGILTFGHAAFFGLGAYGCGLLVVHLGLDQMAAWAGLVVGVLVAALGGLVIGGLALRRAGTYLALITLGFAQMLWFIVFQWRSFTGGDDGLVGVPTPALGVPGVFVLEFRYQGPFFLLILAIFTLSLVAMKRLRNSNFGRTLNAIRENENRAEFLGYDVYRYKLAAFVVSAAFAGLAGSLYPFFLNVVGLNTLHWQLSGEVNFWVLLGGVNTFVGPVIGTGLFLLLRDTISVWTSHWQLPVGLLFIAIVLFFPEGLIGDLKERLGRRVRDVHDRRLVPESTADVREAD